MAVTLKDVAAHASVSIKTVSNVVNERPYISRETRERVRQSIETLGYRPDAGARHLRKAHVGVFALAVPDLANTYFADISHEVIAAARARAYTVLVDHTGGEQEQEVLIAHGLRPHLIDGLILSADAVILDDLRAESVPTPMVLIGERMYGAPWDQVMIDNVAATRQATDHLLQLGRRRIALINMEREADLRDPSITTPWRFRLAGFREAMDAAGMTIDPELLLSVSKPTHQHGIDAMRTLLALRRPPDAVVCFNDLLALGALRALYIAGMRAPDDIAVVGFDDLAEGAYSVPSLTTISPDKREIATLATTLLIDRIRGRRTGPPELFMPPFRLVVRESTVGRAAADQQV